MQLGRSNALHNLQWRFIMATKTSKKNGQSVEMLLGKHITIHHHALLNTKPTTQKIQRYLDTFSLLFAGNELLTTHQRSYIRAMCRLLGVDNACDGIQRLMAGPQDVELDAFLAMLRDNDNLQTAWFIDAVFLVCNEGEMDADARKTLMRIAGALDIKSAEANKLIDRAATLATSDDTDKLVIAIGYLNRQCETDAWQTILEYRRISFTSEFNCIDNALRDACLGEGYKILQDIRHLQMNSLMNSMCIGGEGFLMKAAIMVLRKSVIWDYRSLKRRAEALAESHDEAIREGNAILAAFGYQYDTSRLSLVGVTLDENVSLENEDWHETMEAAVESLEQFVTQHIDNVSLLGMKLESIERGNWTEALPDKAEAA
jgi:hypothetical protein